MEEKHTEEERSPTSAFITTFSPSQEYPSDSAPSGTPSPVTNGEKEHEEVTVKEYEASTSETTPDAMVLSDVGAKLTSSEEQTMASAEGIAAEKSEVYDSVSTQALGNNKPEVCNHWVQPEEERDGSIVVTSVDGDTDGRPIISKESETMQDHFDTGSLHELPPQEEIFVKPSESSLVFNLSVSSPRQVESHRALVDTAAPFESVREAVTKFGEIADFKAHKMKTMERRRFVELELEKVQKGIPECKKELEIAENEKKQVLQELESTKRFIEELKVGLEKAHTEEEQAKQDSQFAQMRVEEIKQGIADEASVAAKAQLETAKARHEAALSELKLVKEETEALKSEYISLIEEKDKAVKKAEDAVSASKEIEKTVEELTLELMSTKESLELAHASHLEAEECRVSAALARKQEDLKQEKEMKAAEEETQKLIEQLSASKDLKTKLETASSLLLDLKAELAAYMEAKLDSETSGAEEEKILTAELEEAKNAQRATLIALSSTTKELEDVRAQIEKSRKEVECLRIAAISLQSELEEEKSTLTSMRQREGIANVTVSALEAELTKTWSEVEAVRTSEKETREKMVELPRALQEAAQEADQAKLSAVSAREDLCKAKEEAELVKAGASTVESRLRAATKEIEAAKASEKLALAAINALHESEMASRMLNENEPSGVTLSLEQYYELSKKAHEAEEVANARVAAAMLEIDAAKEAEMRSLKNLEAASKELSAKREALAVEKVKAEHAKEGKLGVEQELRNWRAEHEQRRKANESASGVVNLAVGSPRKSTEESQPMHNHDKNQDSKAFSLENNAENVIPDPNAKKKKKSLFPKIIMLLARKRR
ncbi:protein WEAK CHLOROPLAST MOVEMENT UNDER BLUE LIGHT 1-like [Nymphaea colorata]|nr:protein WEAK CHLOROPLAST MOVEMENT UNDER BLUE LIGHT 1-like [Nymphaea colorata]XP_031492920.1 protein WEAK CHLOROPLAST MOVEMENT UNDER BLUE LIGHT 1-like [Nymphaea colorata]